jgi:uncharacterized repeat protein (TIGR03803 family)
MVKFNFCMRACGILLLWTMAAVALPAQSVNTLYNFNNRDGAKPVAGLALANDGNLYGTAGSGGANGGGTVFKIDPRGRPGVFPHFKLTVLHSFSNRDGARPLAGLVRATDGSFYGTTYQGGPADSGTVFKIAPDGTLTTLHSFDGTDGAEPYGAALVLGTDGNFYGTTYEGGANGYGTAFKITPASRLTTLHSFDSTDGAYPQAGLVQGTDGNFYGTTSYGGANRDNAGTVFKMTPDGTLTTLYSFCSRGGNCTDGAHPEAALIQGTDGDFYGTTLNGGTNGPYVGTVFKITPSGTLTTLYNFCSQLNCTDGAAPQAALIQATDGNFYGTTDFGGDGDQSACLPFKTCGTVFKITPSGTLTTLNNFCVRSNCTDGYTPYGALVQATDGEFYGTTYLGGTHRYGTVFRLSAGLEPFVVTQPTSGTVGKAVRILGNKLTDATSVTFNGTAATFTVKSKSEITTTVPTGATTGTVQVVTPSGTLSSNVPFRVKQ